MPQLQFEFVSEINQKRRALRLEPRQEKALVARMAEAIVQLQKGGQKPDEEKPSVETEDHSRAFNTQSSDLSATVV